MRTLRRLIGVFLVGLTILLPPAAIEPAMAQRVRGDGGAGAAAETGLPAEVMQIAQQFGGVYQDPELQRYIRSLGQLLVSTTEMADQRFTFNVLDSPIVNAFALPGGFVFVTRGLLALANSEAEVAGVMGHEIGHVTAGHHTQRQTRGAIAQIGAGLLGALLGSPNLGQLAGAGAALYLQKYSRDQEFEADELGVRYMSRAGFDPNAMAWFLQSLEMQTDLEARIVGRPAGDDGFSMLSDHPRTMDRVQRALAEAREATTRQPMVERDIYLRKIDGMLYGENPNQGVVRDRVFLHPELRFRFEVPQGFHLNNGDRQVVAKGPGGSLIIFDRNPRPFQGSAVDYLTRGWAANAQIADVERFDVNGLDAATGRAQVQTQNGAPADARLVAIRFDRDTFYRFLFVAPPQVAGRLEPEFKRTAYSFRELSEREAAQIRPFRLRIVTAGPGDSVGGFARRMATPDHQQERFLVLNGLRPGDQIRPGDKVKIVE